MTDPMTPRGETGNDFGVRPTAEGSALDQKSSGAEVDYSVLIPKDPAKRAALAKMAGLTDEERLAIDLWCAEQQREYEARLRRGLERCANEPMP